MSRRTQFGRTPTTRPHYQDRQSPVALGLAEGDGIDQTHFSLRPQNPNSLRNLKPVKYPQFIPLKLPTKNAGWTLWNNSSIKHVDRNAGTINGSGPTSISAYELDINYSFHF
jgi:hypothetical protein